MTAVAVTVSGAFAAGGRLQLYLVNSGPQTAVYNESSAVDGNCNRISKAASLSTSTGTAVQSDSPGYAFSSTDPHPSRFSYTVPAGGGFKVKPNENAVMLKLWSFSGDGSCDGQNGDQTIDWRVLCSGSCGSNVSLTGPGQDKPDWQALQIPAGTPVNTLANDHAGPSATVTVGAGDVITLELSADTWSAFRWSAPNGSGASSLAILQS